MRGLREAELRLTRHAVEVIEAFVKRVLKKEESKAWSSLQRQGTRAAGMHSKFHAASRDAAPPVQQ